MAIRNYDANVAILIINIYFFQVVNKLLAFFLNKTSLLFLMCVCNMQRETRIFFKFSLKYF